MVAVTPIEALDYAVWRKACGCAGTATTNQIRFGPSYDRGDNFVVEVHFYPGPSCDRCGKPWVQSKR